MAMAALRRGGEEAELRDEQRSENEAAPLRSRSLPAGGSCTHAGGWGEEAGLPWAWRRGSWASPPAASLPASPPSAGGGVQAEEEGSLGEMMRCLVLLQR